MRNILLILAFFCCSATCAKLSGTGIYWMNFEQAQQATKPFPRMTVVYIYVEQDEFCKLMDKTVFTNARVIAALNNEFYPVRFNGQEPGKIVFKGHEFSNLNDAHRLHALVHPLLSMSTISLPAFAFLDEDFNLITTIVGYQSVDNLLEALSFIKRQYLRVNWEARSMFSKALTVRADAARSLQPQPAISPQPDPVTQALLEPEPQLQGLSQPLIDMWPEDRPEPIVHALPEPEPKLATDVIPTPATIISEAPIMTGVIKWYTLEEADKLCKVAPRKFFIDMYTDWCNQCKRMDRETFTDPTLANYINDNFYPVKLNAESKFPITFNNRTYLSHQRTHDIAISLTKGQLVGYPTYVILDQNRQTEKIFVGYMGVALLYQRMVYVGEGYNASNDNDFHSQWPQIKEATDRKYKPKH